MFGLDNNLEVFPEFPLSGSIFALKNQESNGASGRVALASLNPKSIEMVAGSSHLKQPARPRSPATHAWGNAIRPGPGLPITEPLEFHRIYDDRAIGGVAETDVVRIGKGSQRPPIAGAAIEIDQDRS